MTKSVKHVPLNQGLMDKINKIDLTNTRNRMIVKKGWAVDATDNAILWYRRYLYLAVAYPGSGLSPTDLVDEVWHDHILHTAKYARDCQVFAGRYIHHQPFETKLGELFGKKCEHPIIDKPVPHALADCDISNNCINIGTDGKPARTENDLAECQGYECDACDIFCSNTKEGKGEKLDFIELSVQLWGETPMSSLATCDVKCLVPDLPPPKKEMVN